MTDWWRENRVWLAVLPLCVAAAAAASSYDLKRFWYDEGLHHEVAEAAAGEWATATMDYEDAVGDTSRSFRVRLDGLDTRARWPYYDDGPRRPPEGLEAVVAHLDWEAEPDQVLFGCRVALVDDDGRRYELESGDTLALCAPEDHLGPLGPYDEDDDRTAVEPGSERPPTWSTEPVFLVPGGRRITELRVWWETPDYVRLSAP